jgi:glycosyltransferase involved in cell wall biosynthesis
VRILHVVSSLKKGGKERQLVELMRALKEFPAVRCHVLVLSAENDEGWIEGIRDRLTVIDRRRAPVRSFFRVVSAVRRFRPDIVHVWDHPGALYSLAAARRVHAKFIDGSIRGAQRWRKRLFILKWTLPFTDILVANSFAGLKSIDRSEDEKFRVIHNGFDFDRLKKAGGSRGELKRRLGVHSRFVVGMVANVRSIKDHKTFLEAAIRMVGGRSDVTFISIGRGTPPDSDRIRNDKRLNGRILLLGSRPDVEEIVGIFDVAVLTCDTIAGAEGLSNSILEYMALAKPVIATDSGGNREIVMDRETGFLIPPFDVEELCRRIHELLNDAKLRSRMGRSGRRRVERSFSMNAMRRATLDLYESLHERDSRSGPAAAMNRRPAESARGRNRGD